MFIIPLSVLIISIPCIHLYWKRKYQKYTEEFKKYNQQIRKDFNKTLESLSTTPHLVLDDDVLDLDQMEDGSYQLVSLH